MSSGGRAMLCRAHSTARSASSHWVRKQGGQLSKGTLATGPDNLARGRSQSQDSHSQLKKTTTRKASAPPTGRSQLRTALGVEQHEVRRPVEPVGAHELAPTELKPEFPTAKNCFGHAAFQLVCMRNVQLVCKHDLHAQRSTINSRNRGNPQIRAIKGTHKH